MIDNIINSVKGELLGNITKQFGLDSAKATQSIDIAKEAVMGGVQKEVQGGNIQGLLGMFNNPAGIQSNPIVSGITSNVVTELTGKLGVSSSAAGSIAQMIIPAIISKFSGSAGGNLDASKLLSMVGGSAGGGLLGNVKDKFSGETGKKVGGLFGK